MLKLTNIGPTIDIVLHTKHDFSTFNKRIDQTWASVYVIFKTRPL